MNPHIIGNDRTWVALNTLGPVLAMFINLRASRVTEWGRDVRWTRYFTAVVTLLFACGNGYLLFADTPNRPIMRPFGMLVWICLCLPSIVSTREAGRRYRASGE